MLINSISDFRRAVRNGPWPGGYPVYWIMGDGEAVAFDVGRVSWEGRLMLEALRDNNPRDQWRPVALEVNRDNPDLYCSHTGGRIPCAYDDYDD